MFESRFIVIHVQFSTIFILRQPIANTDQTSNKHRQRHMLMQNISLHVKYRNKILLFLVAKLEFSFKQLVI